MNVHQFRHGQQRSIGDSEEEAAGLSRKLAMQFRIVGRGIHQDASADIAGVDKSRAMWFSPSRAQLMPRINGDNLRTDHRHMRGQHPPSDSTLRAATNAATDHHRNSRPVTSRNIGMYAMKLTQILLHDDANETAPG